MENSSEKRGAAWLALLTVVLISIALAGVIFAWRLGRQELSETTGAVHRLPYADKTVLFVNSYHDGYLWSDTIFEAVERTIAEKSGASVQVTHMDTKNNPSDEFGVAAGLKVKAEIERLDPDVVIVCDDAAFKYVVMPHYRNSELPFSFCGVNFSLEQYGGPYLNTTGIIEVAPYDDIMAMMRPFAEGDSIGFISGDNISEYRNAKWLGRFMPEGTPYESVFVSSAEEWKREFISLQERVDMVVVGVNAGISGWNDGEMIEFMERETVVPTGVEQEWMMPYAVFGATKIPGEHGEVAANAALEMLSGVSPVSIPIVTNERSGKFVNLRLVEKLGYGLPDDLLSGAVIVR